MRPEFAAYQPQIEILVSFVEGKIDGRELDAALATEEMKSLLSTFEDVRYPASTNHHRRLHDNQNRASLGGLVNSEGIIEDFLKKAGVEFQSARRFGKIYTLILKTLPKYLDPPLEYITEKVLPSDSALSDAQKQKLMKERFKEYFRFLSKPPNWIQNPDWPIHEGKPLTFIGQIEIESSELFHDDGAAYVFCDPSTGSFETIAQFH